MSVIDVEQLLSQITVDAPCGEDLEYDPAFVEMEKLAQGTPERQYGGTIIPAEPPDWRGVRKKALALFERTRDLRVGVYLTRAMLNTDGLPGFADGLILVEGLIERYWEEAYPRLDPDDDHDPTMRVNTIVTLCDPATTLRSLRETPLVSSPKVGRFSLRDVHIVTGVLTIPKGKDQPEPPTQAKLDAAFQDANPEEVQATGKLLTDAVQRAKNIEAVLTDRVGVTNAADMSELAAVLKEMRQVVVDQMQRLGLGLTEEVGADEVGAETATEGDSEPGAKPGGKQRLVLEGEIATREDAMRLLDKVCDFFVRYEPSSPIPFFLKRARTLGTKDFMEVLRDLAPGGTDQAKLIFGLRDGESN